MHKKYIRTYITTFYVLAFRVMDERYVVQFL